jgi:phosphoribosylcarboxyaminoimidazole (NCAIR) mutase
MPKGVPVACMSIGKAGAINAAYLSKRILDLVGWETNGAKEYTRDKDDGEAPTKHGPRY